MPVAPFFCRDEKQISINFNGGYIDLKWLKKCQKKLNYLIDNLDKQFIQKYNKDIDDYLNSLNSWNPNHDYPKSERIKQTGYIYLIKQDNYYKIGRAKEIKIRIKRYITENPNPLKIILQIKVNDYVKTETELLQQYKKKQFRGEWFLLNSNDVKEIKNYLTELKQE